MRKNIAYILFLITLFAACTDVFAKDLLMQFDLVETSSNGDIESESDEKETSDDADLMFYFSISQELDPFFLYASSTVARCYFESIYSSDASEVVAPPPKLSV